ncbi:Tat pathway signal sequence domain protein [Streptomyces sp. CoH17]|uniref:Tat pathway signal sequence domain protein n=1 Tax=Streptomyces sp. CoH17 TaxID=2992806 RepID=UPI00227119F7|nr:Tat pathway signal sequence domain protein [Streptomyces sp. CoH17]
MSGIGPVEPGEDTRVREAPPPRPRGRLARACARHRRAVLVCGAALLALAGGGYLYASRPQPSPPPPPPYPSQAIDLVYGAPATGSPQPAAGAFTFVVLLSVRSGPPVTVTRLTQPYDGLSVTTSPAAPFQTNSHSARKIIVTLRVTECEKAPRNPGLPFLDVTLRNARAIEAHSFILGTRYARDLSRALEAACGRDSR